MADLRSVDIRLVIGRLRPGSAYHWRGNGAIGNDYDAIGEWRDARTSKPTEAEILAEWQVYQQEQATKQAAEQQRKNKLNQARQDYGGAEIDLAAYGGQSALIQKIVQKILLLEREIADLRGG